MRRLMRFFVEGYKAAQKAAPLFIVTIFEMGIVTELNIRRLMGYKPGVSDYALLALVTLYFTIVAVGYAITVFGEEEQL